MCIQAITRALSTTAKKWRESRRPPVTHGYTHWACSCHGILPAHGKEWGTVICYTWLTLKSIMLGDRSRAQKAPLWDSRPLSSQNREARETRSTAVRVGGQEDGQVAAKGWGFLSEVSALQEATSCPTAPTCPGSRPSFSPARVMGCARKCLSRMVVLTDFTAQSWAPIPAWR